MVYEAEISRNNPTCFIFLIDQSGSMDGKWGETSIKSNAVADIMNKLLHNLVMKCSKGETIRDYFHISAIGYGTEVKSAFGGPLGQEDKQLLPISVIGENPVRIDKKEKKVSDGAGGYYKEDIKFPVWIDPVNEGRTPMCEALNLAKGIISTWVSEYPDSYPPLVINITDGEATDGIPSSVAEEIKSMKTSDGNALLFNVHISSSNSIPIMYPDKVSSINDKNAELLFAMSSVLPPHLQRIAREEYRNITEASRGYGFNVDNVSLVDFLDIGTRPANMR